MRPLRLAFLILDIPPIAHLQAFLYLYQVCEALAYTHSMGIIHRWSASAAPHVMPCALMQFEGTLSPRTFS